jgi:hypothetical protein
MPACVMSRYWTALILERDPDVAALYKNCYIASLATSSIRMYHPQPQARRHDIRIPGCSPWGSYVKNIRYTSVRREMAEMLEFYLRVAQAHPEERTAQSSEPPKDRGTVGDAPVPQPLSS